jgi:hypothetical protein
MSTRDSARASYLAARRPAVFKSRKLTPGIASHAAISVVEEREDKKRGRSPPTITPEMASHVAIYALEEREETRRERIEEP